MVEGGGHLNQSLKKHLIRVLSFKPNLFPKLVGFEKMTRIERFQALFEDPTFFVCIHAPSRDNAPPGVPSRIITDV